MTADVRPRRRLDAVRRPQILAAAVGVSTLTRVGTDRDRLGIPRAIEPPGVLPYAARVLDAAAPTDQEAAIDVEMLGIDATSFRVIRERSDGDPEAMAALIARIVAERGKLQNPWTGSGGVLVGRVASVGRDYAAGALSIGARVVPLTSLIAVPLALDAVGPVDPADPQVPARGRAIVTGAMACAPVPEDMSTSLALRVFDIYPSASYVRELAAPGDHVLVLGAGHAGLLALAAARDAVGREGRVTVVDISEAALARARAVDPAAAAARADVTDPVAVAAELAAHGLPGGDLTLLCTTVPGAEGTAMLATEGRGTIVFFSTATSFAAAALGPDAIGSRARLVIPNGLTDDRGGYAFELVRRRPALRAALEDGR